MSKKPVKPSPKKKKDTDPIRMVVSAKLFKYLTYLSKTTTLGASENDVAEKILTNALEEMRASEMYSFKFAEPPDV